MGGMLIEGGREIGWYSLVRMRDFAGINFVFFFDDEAKRKSESKIVFIATSMRQAGFLVTNIIGRMELFQSPTRQLK